MTDKASTSIDIDAPASKVWAALTRPELIKAYMFGTTVKTDWQVGHPILWQGEYQGQTYEDKGTVVESAPEERLTVTHWSPMSKLADEPDNYHTITYDLAANGEGTTVTLTQENLTGSTPEQAMKPWKGVLQGLKQTAEQ